MKDYYAILEITSSASLEVIKAAYRALVKKYHPDNNENNLQDNKDISDINEAYEILSNEEKRIEYDRKYKETFLKSNNTGFKQKESAAAYSYTNQADYTNREYYTNQESYTSQAEKKQYPEKKDGLILSLFKSFGRELKATIEKNQQEVQNAYMDGCSMDEFILVRRFKNSKGAKRIGYAKALEEKGLLVKNSNGEYKATSLMKRYW